MAKHPSDRLAAINRTPPTPPVSPKPSHLNISWLLRSWRTHNGITGMEASKLMNLNHSSYTRLEADKGVDMETFQKLLTWLGSQVPPQWVPSTTAQRRLYIKSSTAAVQGTK